MTILVLSPDRKIFDNSSLKEFIDKVATLPLLAQPGEKYNYSISTDVLGYLVQVVSEMPFDRFVRTRILTPLRMNETFFDVPKAKLGRVAKTYTLKDGKLSESPPDDLVGNAMPPVPYGGMGLCSTFGDYARFGQMLLNAGQLDGVRLLNRKTVELMTANHLNNLAVPHTGGTGAYGFGLGGSVRADLAKGNVPGSLGQFGWDGAATTSFRMDPQEGTVSLVFFQYLPFDKAALEMFSTLMYQAIVDWNLQSSATGARDHAWTKNGNRALASGSVPCTPAQPVANELILRHRGRACFGDLDQTAPS